MHVRRSVHIDALPGRVWQEFETFERLQGWLDLGHTLHKLEPSVGGQVELSVDIQGERQFFGGRVLTYDPGRELTLSSQWQSDSAWSMPTLWTIRLTPLYDGTLVELFHHGFERLGSSAGDELQSYEEGWDVKHLKALRAIIHEQPLEGPRDG